MGAILIIMKRAGRGAGAGAEGGARPRPQPTGDDGTGEEQQELDPYEQVGDLPRWMHWVIDDAWWKVLEMMGMWP